MSHKLWPQMLIFFCKWAILGRLKKSFFSELKNLKLIFKIYIMWKALIWPMSQKLRGVLVCRQLWILYSKIIFEVFYFTQFSIFFEKKIIQCRLSIKTLQPLGLAFFNSINKFLTILYFESFSTSFYLLLFPYMLDKSK